MVVVTERVLLVEDDDGIRVSLRMALEDEGYVVDEAASAEEALVFIPSGESDVVLVDVMLPGMSGLDLVREVRRTSGIPVVMVTARTDSHDVVAGLEAGADDYVRKPFEVKELTARMRALLRRARDVRPGADGAHRVLLAGLELSPDGGTVTRDGDELALTRTEFRLLCELAEHRGIVLSREQLLDRVWGYEYLGDTRLVDAHVRRLRAKIERDPSNPEIVVTARGLGYKLAV